MKDNETRPPSFLRPVPGSMRNTSASFGKTSEAIARNEAVNGLAAVARWFDRKMDGVHQNRRVISQP